MQIASEPACRNGSGGVRLWRLRAGTGVRLQFARGRLQVDRYPVTNAGVRHFVEAQNDAPRPRRQRAGNISWSSAIAFDEESSPVRPTPAAETTGERFGATNVEDADIHSGVLRALGRREVICDLDSSAPRWDLERDVPVNLIGRLSLRGEAFELEHLAHRKSLARRERSGAHSARGLEPMTNSATARPAPRSSSITRWSASPCMPPYHVPAGYTTAVGPWLQIRKQPTLVR